MTVTTDVMHVKISVTTPAMCVWYPGHIAWWDCRVLPSMQ